MAKNKAKAKAGGQSLEAWQVGGPPQRGFSLAALDPAAKPFSRGSKARDEAAVEALALEIDQLQDLLFADGRFKVLVVLQGLDGSGKDGTIRHVFGRVSPLGVRTHNWRAPTENELAHDFLWRIHQYVPAAGELMIFNRSHYEDVLVPVAALGMKPAEAEMRCRQINDFERMLCETGTLVLKFMLLVSKDEQRQRLQARIDDPAKAWKYDPHDLDVRKLWDQYQKAYEFTLAQTGTAHAPWTIVPSDSKTHRNLMIATLVRDAMAALGLRYPPAKAGISGTRVK